MRVAELPEQARVLPRDGGLDVRKVGEDVPEVVVRDLGVARVKIDLRRNKRGSARNKSRKSLISARVETVFLGRPAYRKRRWSSPARCVDAAGVGSRRRRRGVGSR